MALSKNIRINDRKKVTSQTKGEGVQNVSESFACTNNISVYWIRVYLEQCDPQRLSLNTLCSGKRAKRETGRSNHLRQGARETGKWIGNETCWEKEKMGSDHQIKKTITIEEQNSWYVFLNQGNRRLRAYEYSLLKEGVGRRREEDGTTKERNQLWFQYHHRLFLIINSKSWFIIILISRVIILLLNSYLREAFKNYLADFFR